VQNEGLDEGVRTIAALRLKNALYAQDAALMRERSDRWKGLEQGLRDVIKGTVLQSLMSNSMHVRNSAAQVVQRLAYLEMEPTEPEEGAQGPNKTKWDSLLPTLVGGLGAADSLPVGVRASCARTIGFVFEALDEYEDSPLAVDVVETVLKALLASIQAPIPEVQLEAMKALNHALVFLSDFFTVQDRAEYKTYRDAIIGFCMMLAGNAASPAPLREASLDVLVKIAEYYYAQLYPYIAQLAPFTAQLASGQDEVRSTVWGCAAWATASARAHARVCVYHGLTPSTNPRPPTHTHTHTHKHTTHTHHTHTTEPGQ
jgi:importin subunit beta-1